MRLITTADDVLLESANVAAKLAVGNHLLDHLYDRYEASQFDGEAGFRLALAQVAALGSATNDLQRHQVFSEVTEILSATLEDMPDHWPARYLRARLRALVPPTYGDVVVYLGAERQRAARDLDTLLHQQRSTTAQSYFSATYLLRAHTALVAGDDEHALALIREAHVDTCRQPITFPSFTALLREPFRHAIGHLTASSRTVELAMVNDLQRALFADVKGAYG